VNRWQQTSCTRRGLRPCDPLKTKTKNLSKKKEQEAFCALPLVEIEQDASLAGSG
jgi:hypothetical protein